MVQTLEVYEDGARLLYDEESETWKYNNGSSVVKHFEASVSNRNRERDARMFAELDQRSPGVGVESSHNIPIRVAALGKPAIAAYMKSVEGMRDSEIAHELGINHSDVNKLITEFMGS